MPVSLLAEAKRLELALALLRRRARISIVYRELGISRKQLRALYVELHGQAAPCGPLPALGGAKIANRALQIQAGLFAGIDERYVSGQDGGRARCPDQRLRPLTRPRPARTPARHQRRLGDREGPAHRHRAPSHLRPLCAALSGGQ
jgi:hypothetical protein